MNLIEKIKKDALAAWKEGNKDKKLVLTTLVAEIQRNEPTLVDGQKTWTDDQCIKTIKKLVEANEECKNYEENEYLLPYLPQKLSSVALFKLILEHIEENDYSGMKDMGKVMNWLSENYSGQYDGKDAATATRTYLSER